MPDKENTKNTNPVSGEGAGGQRYEAEIRDRLMLLQGIVSTLDLCLQSLGVRRDAALLETLQFDRAEAVQDLAQTREELRVAESEDLEP